MNLEEIKQKALDEHIPIIMDDTLEVIKEILLEKNPKSILEIGAAVGYSSICFSKIIPNATIDTIEMDIERAKQAKENIDGLSIKNINLIVGNAVDILPSIEKKYDVIFIDAAKGKYPFFLQESLRLSKIGTTIIADNVLFKGYVLSDYNKHKQRTAVTHLREYIKLIKENDKLETTILDVGDGLSISVIREK